MLIRFEGPFGEPVFIDPETVRGLRDSSAYDWCTFVRTCRDADFGQTVKGAPDEVHARLFQTPPAPAHQCKEECCLPK